MNLEKYIIASNETILTALIKINSNKQGFLIVVDNHNRVQGTLSDGDIRRALIKNGSTDRSIEESYNKNYEKAEVKDGLGKVIDLFQHYHIKYLPVVNRENVLVNIITKEGIHSLLLGDRDFEITNKLIAEGQETIHYEINHRPWGFFKTTFINDHIQSKIIRINPSSSISLQEHRYREEHWVIIKGEGNVTIGDSVKKVEGGSYIYIPKGCKHRLENVSTKNILLVSEVQLGEYFGEDDITRFEDVYGRK